MQRDTGASVRIYNLAKGLSATGNDVRVVMPREETGFEFVDGIAVHWLRGLFPVAVLKVLRRLVQVGRPTALWFYDILFIHRVTHSIRDADVVQIEAQSSGLFLIPFIRRVLRKPVVLDCHDVFQALRLTHGSLIRKSLETFLEKLSYKNADLLLVVSESEKLSLSSSGVKNCNISVVPNGVDTGSYCKSPAKKEIREKYNIYDAPVVVFVGNLRYQPNLEALRVLSSIIAPRVQNEIENVKFVAVGSMQEEPPLPGLIFTGFVDNVADILNISDVAVAPLLQGSGTRLKILEYFSCGLPVVSTPIGAEGLVVQNGVNIFLEEDFERFSYRIVSLLRNKKLSVTLGENARALAESRYDWRIVVSGLEQDYRCLVSQDFVRH